MRTYKLLQWVEGEYRYCGQETSLANTEKWARKRSNAIYITLDKKAR